MRALSRGDVRLLGHGLLIAVALFAGAASAQNMPTLSQVQTAIANADTSSWTAGTNPLTSLTWTQITKRCGLDTTGLALDERVGETPRPYRAPADLPATWDWTNVGGKNYVSSIKDQGSCGSCWAFAAVGALESLRKIKGYTGCGLENLSEQFVVSCCKANSGCDGGNPPKTANCLRDTGTVDESCFAYCACDTACDNRCSDWASRIRKIDSWSYSCTAPRVPTLSELKQAVYQAPTWTTLMVYADFCYYKSGIYRKILGPYLGGHAVLLVGYDDNNKCFKCKNSWGSSWGESGYFRIAYSQIPPRGPRFGRWNQDYSLTQAGCVAYEDDWTEYDWHSVGGPPFLVGDDELAQITLPFPIKMFCTTFDGQVTLCTNGWMCGGEHYEPHWQHYSIPSEEGPPSLIAPLWTDLVAYGGDSGVYYEDLGDGRFVVEWRNMEHWSDPSVLETFQVVIYDRDLYPTPTGDSRIEFRYQHHTPSLDTWPGYTVGIQNDAMTCGTQFYYEGTYREGEGKGAVVEPPGGRAEGTPIAEETAVDFYPIPDGEDDVIPNPVTGLTAVYDEPFVRINWTNPSHDTEGFELDFVGGQLAGRDAGSFSLTAVPGEAQEYSYRETSDEPRDYEMRAQVGAQLSDSVSVHLDLPVRIHYADHDVGNVRFTITDHGACGFLDAGHSAGSGFEYPIGGENLLFIGGLWAATDSLHALNIDYAGDPYKDWLFWRDIQGPATATSDQDYYAEYDDAGHSFPRRLHAQQSSWSWGAAPYDDFAIVYYALSNQSAVPIDHLYVGQFMDWDIPPGGTNWGATDPALRMAYMWPDAGYPYAGVSLLDVQCSPDPYNVNLTMIHNPTYVYPLQYIHDTDRYLFLSAGDPEHVVPTATVAADWSCLVSAGPFDLAAGQAVLLAVAVAGGDDYADLVANVGRAQEIYDAQSTEIAEDSLGTHELALTRNEPNPFNPLTWLRFTLPRRSRATLAVYAASGRLVRTLVDQEMPPGVHLAKWDGRDESGREVASGVYFARLEADGRSAGQKMVLLR